MAIEEQPREDLLRDAVAYPRRLFVDGRKYRVAAEGGLVELTREGRGGRVELKHLVHTAADERAVRIRCQLFMHRAARAKEGKAKS